LSGVSEFEVSTAELAAAREKGAVLIDVRTQQEWDGGHIPGSLHIPMDELSERSEELPDDQRIYVVCAVGGRSLRAAQAMAGAGFDAVSVAGGINQWIDEGRDVE
jgi:rhodanese-related sulfurtransferase